MNQRLPVLGVALLLAMAACSREKTSDSAAAGESAADTTPAQSDSTGSASDTTAAPATQDSTFFEKAGEGGMAEVEAGTLAQEKASSSDVKKFGAMMVKDHTQANEKLKTIATQHGVTLPTQLDTEQQAMKARLAGLSGKDFDKEYIRGQIQDHQTTVELLRTESESGQNQDAKSFAVETLPTVEAHLKQAQDLGKKLKIDVSPGS